MQRLVRNSKDQISLYVTTNHNHFIPVLVILIKFVDCMEGKYFIQFTSLNANCTQSCLHMNCGTDSWVYLVYQNLWIWSPRISTFYNVWLYSICKKICEDTSNYNMLILSRNPFTFTKFLVYQPFKGQFSIFCKTITKDILFVR